MHARCGRSLGAETAQRARGVSRAGSCRGRGAKAAALMMRRARHSPATAPQCIQKHFTWGTEAATVAAAATAAHKIDYRLRAAQAQLEAMLKLPLSPPPAACDDASCAPPPSPTAAAAAAVARASAAAARATAASAAPLHRPCTRTPVSGAGGRAGR
jgi:hypothetical protein